MPDREPPCPPGAGDGRAAGAAAVTRQGGRREPAPADRFGLGALVEGAAADLGGLARAGGGADAAERALARFAEGILRANMRLADAVLGPEGADDLAGLQRRFLRDYLAALARGGTMLLDAAHRGAGGAGAAGAGTVGDAMRRDVACAGPDDTVRDAWRRMRESRLSALPVCEGGRLVGLAVERDLAERAAAGGGDVEGSALRAVMRADPAFVFDDDPLALAIVGMADQRAPCLPVVDRGRRLVGVLALDAAAPQRTGPDAAG